MLTRKITGLSSWASSSSGSIRRAVSPVAPGSPVADLGGEFALTDVDTVETATGEEHAGLPNEVDGHAHKPLVLSSPFSSKLRYRERERGTDR